MRLVATRHVMKCGPFIWGRDDPPATGCSSDPPPIHSLVCTIVVEVDFYYNCILHVSRLLFTINSYSRRCLAQTKHLYRITPCPKLSQQLNETTRGACHLRFHNFFHTDAFHSSHNVGNPWDLARLVPALDHRIRTPLLFLDSLW